MGCTSTNSIPLRQRIKLRHGILSIITTDLVPGLVVWYRPLRGCSDAWDLLYHPSKCTATIVHARQGARCDKATSARVYRLRRGP